MKLLFISIVLSGHDKVTEKVCFREDLATLVYKILPVIRPVGSGL